MSTNSTSGFEPVEKTASASTEVPSEEVSSEDAKWTEAQNEIDRIMQRAQAGDKLAAAMVQAIAVEILSALRRVKQGDCATDAITTPIWRQAAWRLSQDDSTLGEQD